MYVTKGFSGLTTLLLAAALQTVHANELMNNPPPPLPERPRPCEPAGPNSSEKCEADTYELWSPLPLTEPPVEPPVIDACPQKDEGADIVPAYVECEDITQAPTGLKIECEPFGSEQLHCWVWPVGRELLHLPVPPEPLGVPTAAVGYGWNFVSGLTGQLLQPLGASVLVSCINHGVDGGVLEVVLTSPVGLRASLAKFIDCAE